MDTLNSYNARILDRLSLYLNYMPDAIDKKQVYELCGNSADSSAKEYAFGTLLAAYCGLDTEYSCTDRKIFRSCFTRMVKLQHAQSFSCDEYYKNIKFPEISVGEWQFKLEAFKPYEAFLIDETQIQPDGTLLPQIGFFESEFCYPAVLQNGREWMTITPHEINSTKNAVSQSRGRVLTYGLGLGYFTYLASLKDEVESVTVAELDSSLIGLFEKYLLPQFPYRDKIRIVNTDAFDFAQKYTQNGEFDFIFADTWHDPSDGVDMYLRFKALENNNSKTVYSYWIEKTLKYYMSH